MVEDGGYPMPTVLALYTPSIGSFSVGPCTSTVQYSLALLRLTNLVSAARGAGHNHTTPHHTTPHHTTPHHTRARGHRQPNKRDRGSVCVFEDECGETSVFR